MTDNRAGANGVSVIIPTLNGGRTLGRLLDALACQTLRPREVIVIDSSSLDETPLIAKRAGAALHIIPRREFDHGGTRNLAARLASGDTLLFCTQDVLPVDDTALENLVGALDPASGVAASYGRQMPYPDATPIAAHARLFNYPPASRVVAFEDRRRLGFRAAFFSNSFSAFQRGPFEEMGGFKEGMVFGEDSELAARLIMKGFRTAYAAGARVYHSHNYTLLEEFRRYFDVGAFHEQSGWMLREFGGAGGEGRRFVRSEAGYLMRTGSARFIPSGLFRSGAKYLGYRLGRMNRTLPRAVSRRLSMNPAFWRRSSE